MKKIGLLIIAAVLLPACSSPYASNGEQLYLKSHNGPRVVAPPPLSDSNLSHFYDLPQESQDPHVSIEAPN